jgi:hypothetical protein
MAIELTNNVPASHLSEVNKYVELYYKNRTTSGISAFISTTSSIDYSSSSGGEEGVFQNLLYELSVVKKCLIDSDKLNEIIGEVNTNSDSITNLTASQIPVVDAGGYFSTKNLEAATQTLASLRKAFESINHSTYKWSLPGWSFTYSTANPVPAFNRIYYVPIYLPKKTLFSAWGTNVKVAYAGAIIESAIYKNENGVPTDLVANLGSVASTTTGLKEVLINFELESGYYFLAHRASGTGDAPSFSATNGSVPFSMAFTSLRNTQIGTYRLVLTTTSGTLSNPAPAVNGSDEITNAVGVIVLKEV